MYLALLVLFFVPGGTSIDVEDLLSSLSLAEKVGQMTQLDINMFINSTNAEIDYQMMSQWIGDVQVQCW